MEAFYDGGGVDVVAATEDAGQVWVEGGDGDPGGRPGHGALPPPSPPPLPANRQHLL